MQQKRTEAPHSTGAGQALNATLIEEIMQGLRHSPRYINPKFLYDERGSQLFDRITRLPEYYPTRTEIGILRERAVAIAERAGEGAVLIEPGAGSCEKVRYLLEALRPATYIPQDISAGFLQQTAQELESHFPWLHVLPLVGDFADDIELPADTPGGRRILFYPGSTIGNFAHDEAIGFLRRMRALIGEDGAIILGADLQKAPATLHAAYNDSAGVTAEFNRNVLRHLSRLLDAEFMPECFEHIAVYDEQEGRVEMYLRCQRSHKVSAGGTTLSFRSGEHILTEYSYKYTRQGLADTAAQAGLRLEQTWTDRQSLFSVNYLVSCAAADRPSPG